MSNKIYKSAMGKTVDLGALMLENENTRAVGNMNVNARGDVLDSANRVIDPKTRQVQRQYQRQTLANTSKSDLESVLVADTRSAKKLKAQQEEQAKQEEIIDADDTDVEEEVVVVEETADEPSTPRGGLAAAIAKSQSVKQELLKTPRQLAQEQRTGIKKI